MKHPGRVTFHGGPLDGDDRWLQNTPKHYECIIGPPPLPVSELPSPETTIAYRVGLYELQRWVDERGRDLLQYHYLGTGKE